MRAYVYSLNCDFKPLDMQGSYCCSRCQYTAHGITALPYNRTCEHPVQSEFEAGVGGCLSLLLKMVGVEYTRDCQCAKRAAEMDEMGPQWCRDNIDTTIFWMSEEAQERGMTFLDSQARWLVMLAITLTEEAREPTKIERVRLRAMRLGNRILNGPTAA